MGEIKFGKSMQELQVGDGYRLTEQVEDSQLLLYLGLTKDNNPLYLQHDFAKLTEYNKPQVPTILLTGLITSSISKHLPGPGSRILNMDLNFLEPVYHYETLTYTFKITKVDERKEMVTISVEAVNQKNQRVLDANILVEPPKRLVPAEKGEGKHE